MTVLEELRNRAAEIEDEIGRLEDERVRFVTRTDRQIKDLRTLLRLVRDDQEVTAPVRRAAPHRNPLAVFAVAVKRWDDDDGPMTARAVAEKVGGYQDATRPRLYLKDLVEYGALEYGPSVPSEGGKGVLRHTFLVKDPEKLQEVIDDAAPAYQGDAR